MKYITFAFFIAFPLVSWSQPPIIIDHTSLGLSLIPTEWIDSAKARLHIGYGHTSHGSQLTSGMDAVDAYYPGVHMEVYPNPARDRLNIIFSVNLHCRLVEILDLQGKPVYSLHLNKECRNLTLWDLHLPGGVYFLKIVTNSCVIARKASFL